MKHLIDTNIIIERIESQHDTIESTSRMQSKMLKMLYVIARLLAQILDKMEEVQK